MKKDRARARSTPVEPEKDDGFDELTNGGEDVLLEAEEKAVAPEENDVVLDATPEDEEEEHEPREYVIDEPAEDAEKEKAAPVHKLSKPEVLRRLLDE